MTPRSPLAQRHDEYLQAELSNLALAVESLAGEMSDANSALTDRADRIAGQVRALLAHVKGEQR